MGQRDPNIEILLRVHVGCNVHARVCIRSRKSARRVVRYEGCPDNSRTARYVSAHLMHHACNIDLCKRQRANAFIRRDDITRTRYANPSKCTRQAQYCCVLCASSSATVISFARIDHVIVCIIK